MTKALLVPGHTLMWEGAAHDDNGIVMSTIYGVSRGGSGRAKCSCGELSEPFRSSTQRRQWHRDHKNQILADRVLEEIKQAGGFEQWRDETRGVDPEARHR